METFIRLHSGTFYIFGHKKTTKSNTGDNPHFNMKKNVTILSLIFISLFSLTAKAQEDEPQATSYMSFLGGFSFPMGSYGKSIYTDNSAGFAHKGEVYGVDFNILVHKKLGIGVTLAVQDQGQLDSAQVQSLANGYNAAFDKNQT